MGGKTHTKTYGNEIGTREQHTSFSKIGSSLSFFFLFFFYYRKVIILTVLEVLELPFGCITTFTLKFESYDQAIYKTLLYARQSMTCV